MHRQLCNTFHNPEYQPAFILITEQNARFGNSGMLVDEKMDDKQSTFVVSVTRVREQRYAACGRKNSADAAAG